MKNEVDEYIEKFPKSVQAILEELRKTIKEAAPDAKEIISYQIPTFDFNGHLVHFAAYRNHIGFYPTPSGVEKFKKELAGYKSSKGSVQFPINKPLPLSLISKIVKYRLEENQQKFSEKVYEVVKMIPKGKTLSYKEVAELAGSPKAYRAVGNILHKNHNPSIPCHRVICSNGKTGGYNRGEEKKMSILRKDKD